MLSLQKLHPNPLRRRLRALSDDVNEDPLLCFFSKYVMHMPYVTVRHFSWYLTRKKMFLPLLGTSWQAFFFLSLAGTAWQLARLVARPLFSFCSSAPFYYMNARNMELIEYITFNLQCYIILYITPSPYNILYSYIAMLYSICFSNIV